MAESSEYASDSSGSRFSGNILSGLATVGFSGNPQLHGFGWIVG